MKNYPLLLGTSLPLLLSSCYSISIASQYLCLVSQGKSFERVEQPSPQEQLLFQRVLQIKDFAENTLGLRPTQNYSRYVRLDQDYLTAVVSAAPALGFEDYLWSYPFVGKLPYRGYFVPSQAQAEAQRLKQQGYDVFVRPVHAFSSLGYIRDPLFSYMAEYRESRLANLIIHESYHATLFVRGDIALNESLANLVGDKGADLYMQQQYNRNNQGQGTGPKGPATTAEQDRQTLRKLILQLKQELSKIYENPNLTREQALQAKEQTITYWQQQFQTPQYQELFANNSYQYMAEYPINNAYLALFSLYEDPDNFLDNIYQKLITKSNNELTALQDFIALSKRLGNKYGRKTRQALQQYSETKLKDTILK